jgi:hypothetical protein
VDFNDFEVVKFCVIHFSVLLHLLNNNRVKNSI